MFTLPFRFLCCCLLLAALAKGQAQPRFYFVQLTDKAGTPYATGRPREFLSQRAIDRRMRQGIAVSMRDLPVDPAYLAALRQAGARIRYTSRWMNGVLLEADEATLDRIRRLPMVKPLTNRSRAARSTAASAEKSRHPGETTPDYGSSLGQNAMLGIDRMHAAGFRGRGVHIAVLDGGFNAVSSLPAFGPLFAEGRVLGTHDFVRNLPNVYDRSRHGTEVLSVMAGYLPGALVGPAFGASFWLFRTEDETTEYRIEEVNWLVAAERADSAGADIIHSSLGYTDFDDPAMNYRPADMDGRTALVTQAAQRAAATGMLVVVSAGNEGDDPWGTLSAPADGDSVLAVAAVDRFRLRSAFSSFGSKTGNGLKPNVAAQGTGTVVAAVGGGIGVQNGTSVSAPLVTGLAAGLWEAFPNLTNMQLLGYIQRAGSQAATPDTLLGYGIPDFSRAYALIRRETDADAPLGYLSPNPVAGSELLLRINARVQGTPVSVVVTDALGRRLLSVELLQARSENRLVLPPALFPPGMYMLKAVSAGTQTTLRFVKR